MSSGDSEKDVTADPKRILAEGRKVLNPVLLPQGFEFAEGAVGTGSGGPFASGEYVREERRLELHLRHSLGLVQYHMGSLSLSHEAYMECLLGPDGKNAYPGFSEDPLDGFRHLRADLEQFASDFLGGSGEEFKRCCERAGSSRESGMKRLSQVERASRDRADR